MLDLLLVGLVAYRLAKFITMEDGPFDIALKIREWIFRRYGPETWINKGLSCPYCVSFWLALIAAYLLAPEPLWYWLAGAGVASLAFTWEFQA